MTDLPCPKLLVDGMLGRLAKWLRILGYDTAYDSRLDDNELVRRARAEGRWLLTRDGELAGRRGVHSLLIDSGHLASQLAQVRSELGQAKGGPFSRCPVCNTRLEKVSPEDIKSRVPKFILRIHRRFRRCPSCDRIYWPGSHWKRMRKRVLRSEEDAGILQSNGDAPRLNPPDMDEGTGEGEASGID